MRLSVVIMAGALSFSVAPALASPVDQAGWAGAGSDMQVTRIHHKPGHHGGPPWLRRGQDRQDWRDSRRERFYSGYRERRPACRTTYRTYYDSYYGEYVRRPVRVCD